MGVCNVLCKAEPPTSNIGRDMREALKALRSDDSIVILPADKGNMTVILNRKDYDTKIDDLLLDGDTYNKLKKNPTAKVEKKITECLKELHREEYITTEKKNLLTPQYSTSPQLYGLPKVHKEHVPLRPIVANIGSPTYCLAKELARIISPLSGQTQSFMKNSAHFVEKVEQVSLDGHDYMASFDVVSLFTKIPIDEALQVISTALMADQTLDERTSVPPSKLCDLVGVCLHYNYFQSRDYFYEQLEGAAMGSPLSPIVANMFMEALKTVH